MDSQKIIRKNLSLHTNNKIDSHVCSLVIFKQDLQKATQPDSKIISNEYLKALHDLKIIRSTPSISHSYLVDDKFFKDTDSSTKLTFEEWLGRKSELIRSSKKAKKMIKRQKEKEKKEADEMKSHKLALGEEKFKEWKKIKKIQLSSTEKLKIKQKSLQENIIKSKKEAAKEMYHEWLKHSLKSLKQDRWREKQELAKIEEEKAKKEMEKITKSEKAQKVYKEWLENKKKESKIETRIIRKKLKPKRTLMLAYSPNRKKSLSLSKLEESTSNIFYCKNTCKSSLESTKKNTKVNSARLTTKERNEGDQIFDELSSIRKSPKLQSTYRLSEDPESFISVGNHELD